MSTSSGSEVKGSEGAANKSYIRHSTSDYIPGSTASAATAEVDSCPSEWQIKEEQFKGIKKKSCRSPLVTMAMKGC
jgi:hypothetical protein